MDPILNRKINQLFSFISQQIYKSDLKHGDTKDWWPIRPTVLDYPIAPFLFGELIRLFKKADSQGITAKELAQVFDSEEVIDLQFLWPCLNWKKNDLSFEDKLYLVGRLIQISEIAPGREGFVSIYEKLAQETPKEKGAHVEEVLKAGTQIYMSYIKKLYGKLGEEFDQALAEATKRCLEKYDEVDEPPPWGEATSDKAIRQIYRNCDFRREKEKELEQILAGIPQVPGIAEGVVGETIIVSFSIESDKPQAEAYITNVDAFQHQDLEAKCIEEGIVVVGRTRVGTNQLKAGDKVWVDGTSGIVYRA